MEHFNDEQAFLAELKKSKTYSLRLPLFIAKKLEEHLQKAKGLNKTERKKHNWIAVAVLEKLQNDQKTGVLSTPKFLNLELSKSLSQVLRLNLLENKKQRACYSKKQFILEAIEEKIEAEKQMVQKKLTEYKDYVFENGPSK